MSIACCKLHYLVRTRLTGSECDSPAPERLPSTGGADCLVALLNLILLAEKKLREEGDADACPRGVRASLDG